MQLVLHKPDVPDYYRVRRTARTYRIPLHIIGGQRLGPGGAWYRTLEEAYLNLPQPWWALEITEESVPLGDVDFMDIRGGSVIVGYGDGLPDVLLDTAAQTVHVEQFDDTLRLPMDQVASIFCYQAFRALVRERVR